MCFREFEYKEKWILVFGNADYFFLNTDGSQSDQGIF